MKTITKSLHTVTAATNVARHLANERRYFFATALAKDALAILGYDIVAFDASDSTIERIIRECSRIVGERVRVAA